MDNIIFSKIRGVTARNPDGMNRQDIIIHHVRPSQELFLRRDPNNPYDPNAIAVFARISARDVQIGYIGAELAEELAPILDAGGLIICGVTDVTGGGGKSIGVNVMFAIRSARQIARHVEQWQSAFPDVKPTPPSPPPPAPKAKPVQAPPSPPPPTLPKEIRPAESGNADNRAVLMAAIVGVAVIVAACLSACAILVSVSMIVQ